MLGLMRLLVLGLFACSATLATPLGATLKDALVASNAQDFEAYLDGMVQDFAKRKTSPHAKPVRLKKAASAKSVSLNTLESQVDADEAKRVAAEEQVNQKKEAADLARFRKEQTNEMNAVAKLAAAASHPKSKEKKVWETDASIEKEIHRVAGDKPTSGGTEAAALRNEAEMAQKQFLEAQAVLAKGPGRRLLQTPDAQTVQSLTVARGKAERMLNKMRADTSRVGLAIGVANSQLSEANARNNAAEKKDSSAVREVTEATREYDAKLTLLRAQTATSVDPQADVTKARQAYENAKERMQAADKARITSRLMSSATRKERSAALLNKQLKTAAQMGTTNAAKILAIPLALKKESWATTHKETPGEKAVRLMRERERREAEQEAGQP